LLRNREARLSARDRIKALFQAPPVASGLSAFSVYDERDFRNVASGNFTPVFPYIYLLDSFLEPVAQRVDLQQPQVVIEVDLYESAPFELGNRSGRQVDFLFHIFGKNRGERDDLAGLICDHFGGSLDIKTYSATNTTGTVVETALIDPPIIRVKDIFTPRIEKASQVEVNTALLGWSSVSFSVRMKQ
jgi:hypothetical protein